MKVLIGSIFLIVFGCSNLIVSGTHFATLESTRIPNDFATDSVMVMDREYFEDNKETLFSKCENKKVNPYEKDQVVRLKIRCIDMAIVSGLKENGWEVEYFGEFDNQFGKRISTWHLKKD